MFFFHYSWKQKRHPAAQSEPNWVSSECHHSHPTMYPKCTEGSGRKEKATTLNLNFFKKKISLVSDSSCLGKIFPHVPQDRLNFPTGISVQHIHWFQGTVPDATSCLCGGEEKGKE